MSQQNPFDAFDATYMASLNNAYKAAQVYQGGPTILPEGKYQCIVSAFSLKPSKVYQDELTLSLGFEVIQGELKGRTVYKFYDINPEYLDTLKTDMNTLGIDLTEDIRKLGDMSTANHILDQIVDIQVKHKKKQKGEGVYQNIFLNRSMGKANGGFQEVEDDDELPFE